MSDISRGSLKQDQVPLPLGEDREKSEAGTGTHAAKPLPRPWFDALSAVARKKLNAPSEWEWFHAKVLQPTDDTLVEGGIPKRGKNGRPLKAPRRWAGVVGQQCVVTRAEIDAALAEYEATTGKCNSCAGSGETIASVSVKEGTRYRTCRRCEGSGRSSVVLAFDRSRSSPNSTAVASA